jgi:phosphoglycerate dehydrogenase-like enzyme
MVESLLELCRRSDVVTLHLPLRRGTHSLIGAKELDAIGPGGILVNAARGEVVDERALLHVLEQGTLGQAAVDCFATEPPDPVYVRALAATGRAFLTPHIAGVSDRALAALSDRAVDGLIEALGAGGARSISAGST